MGPIVLVPWCNSSWLCGNVPCDGLGREVGVTEHFIRSPEELNDVRVDDPGHQQSNVIAAPALHWVRNQGQGQEIGQFCVMFW
jgi:hypothetical protein